MVKKIKRPSWDEYFMKAAYLVSQRSTCLRRKVGAVLVKDKQILATGYNGAPRGIPHCDVGGCLRRKLKVPSGQRHEICRGLHAEQNVILQAARHGVPLSGSRLYITNTPCVICAKMIVNAGIKEIVCGVDYPDQSARALLRQAKLKLRKASSKRAA